ncbi:hypothetical protein E4U43_004610 [Claviceps pusilla]|uniref:CFEM domain-containing protein n=1 Tax=Claviceps pusilla TaxID=123648 RepID=A0A9P7N358_9HYPO|nr:hypothetical protein E4U43_004610 [Claviceps pusilla]
MMMKYTTLTCLSMTWLVLAQSLSDLPSCATGCLDGAVRQVSTCATSDLVCVCKKFDAIQGAAASCVLGACGKEVALNKVLPVTLQLCAKTSPGSSSGNAPFPQPGNSASVFPQPVTSSATPSPVMTTTSFATTPDATISPTSPTSTVSTGSPISTAGAAVVGPVGRLAMLIAGGLALL